MCRRLGEEVRMLRGNRHISYGRTDDATYVGMSYYLGSYEGVDHNARQANCRVFEGGRLDSFFATHTSGDTGW